METILAELLNRVTMKYSRSKYANDKDGSVWTQTRPRLCGLRFETESFYDHTQPERGPA